VPCMPGQRGHLVLDPGKQPECDYLPKADAPGPHPVYLLQMRLCSSCGLAQLEVYRPARATKARRLQSEPPAWPPTECSCSETKRWTRPSVTDGGTRYGMCTWPYPGIEPGGGRFLTTGSANSASSPRIRTTSDKIPIAM
jgi:hypothetical protein